MTVPERGFLILLRQTFALFSARHQQWLLDIESAKSSSGFEFISLLWHPLRSNTRQKSYISAAKICQRRLETTATKNGYDVLLFHGRVGDVSSQPLPPNTRQFFSLDDCNSLGKARAVERHQRIMAGIR